MDCTSTRISTGAVWCCADYIRVHGECHHTFIVACILGNFSLIWTWYGGSMNALRRYVRILAGERSTLVGIIMVAGSLIGWEMTSETASHVEDLLLGIVNVVGVANMLLPDHVDKLKA